MVFYEVIISSPVGYQFLVLSGFYDFSLVYHHYPVCIFDGTQAVRHYDYRFPFVEFHQVFYNRPFIVGIQCIGGFVQKDVLRILVDGAGYQYPLLLPLAQSYAVLPYQGVVFQGGGA